MSADFERNRLGIVLWGNLILWNPMEKIELDVK